MQAFVTGAGGFVGRHLVPRLAAEGYEVVARDRELDVADPEALEGLLGEHRFELVVHLAAVSSVPHSRSDPGLTYRVNFLGAHHLLCAVARHAPRARVLLVGSGDCYGPAAPGAPPYRESAPLRPRSPYARTKAAADLLGGEWAERGLDVVRVRAFNHTGPGQSDAFVLASFARQAVEIALGQRAPRIEVGNLDSSRDFLDVADVVAAYAALARGGAPAAAYNVASGRAVRIGDALEATLEAAGVEAEVVPDPARHRPADAATGDASRLREATGWAPEVPWEETLRALVASWRERLSAA